MPSYLPRSRPFLGLTIPTYPDFKITELVSSGRNSHVFRAYNESTASQLAFKIIPTSNLPFGDDERSLNEAKKANLLQHPSVVRYHDYIRWQHDQKPYWVFVCDFVDGPDLRTYVRERPTEIDIPFIEEFLRTMFGLLHELLARGFHHGDLHAGNVLVAKSDYDLYDRATFRVTDFGTRIPTGQAAHATDFLYVADVLKSLLNCIDYQECHGRDRYFYNVLRNEFLARHLYETDTTADALACNPRALATKLDSLEQRYRADCAEDFTTNLVTPFDYPNCEQIGNSHLVLKSLYSDRLLGLSEIERRSNLVLTGPRGCGKTTVFRALSLDYLINTDKDDPNNVKYIGIYYRCDDLYFSFPRYREPRGDDLLDIPIHFLISTLLSTALEQVARWAVRRFPAEFRNAEVALAAALWDLFGWDPPPNPTRSALAPLVSRLRARERRLAARDHRFPNRRSRSTGDYFGPVTLFEVVHTIRSHLSFLRDRPFYFFVDDYSHPKITKKLQANLNRMLMHRSADCFFKLSTESPVSFARDDIDGKRFVESREFDLLNLGLQYIIHGPEKPLEFLEDLFRRRFQEVDAYPVTTLKDLLGTRPRNENRAARTFRRETDPDQEVDSEYAGCETIAAMCSGDIHYMISLVSKMVDKCGGRAAIERSTGAPKISWTMQHQTIRSAAGDFMESIRTLPGLGPKLARVVTAFGNVAYSYLLHRDSRNEKGQPPHQASRIEPYAPLDLSDDAREILDELLRYSVFLEDPRGKSRRGEVVPRFYLRRYLIPHFKLTFSHRDSLSLENHDIEMLLCEPESFEARSRLKSTRIGAHPDQGVLFEDDEQ